MKVSFHSRCDKEILFLKEQVRNLSERNDRLTEALAQRSGVDLVLPRPVHEEPAPSGPVGGVNVEQVSAWWKAMNSGSAIASAIKIPKEEQKQ